MYCLDTSTIIEIFDGVERIKEIIDSDNKVRYIGFSRNFGKEMATTAGSHHAKGDALIMIDADLQHPPYLLPEFIKKWE